jgi:hypothetical protein
MLLLLTIKKYLLFPEKEAKSGCPASQECFHYPKLGEADPGGFFLQPRNIFFFQKKKQKAVFLLRRNDFITQNSAKPTLGVSFYNQEISSFSLKRSKKRLSCFTGMLSLPKTRRSRPRGFGGVPPRNR